MGCYHYYFFKYYSVCQKSQCIVCLIEIKNLNQNLVMFLYDEKSLYNKKIRPQNFKKAII